MQADFAIECGADDECLEIPWASEDGTLRFIDMRENPELIGELDEVRRFPELGEFLRSANSRPSAFHSAKCDAGFTREMTLEDEIFGTAGKFGSYVDLLFSSPMLRISFERQEATARRLTELLRKSQEMPAAAEFLVRRCFLPGEPDGFYFTCYVFGYSEDEGEARKLWGIALQLVGSALVQVSAEIHPELRSETGEAPVST